MDAKKVDDPVCQLSDSELKLSCISIASQTKGVDGSTLLVTAKDLYEWIKSSTVK